MTDGVKTLIGIGVVALIGVGIYYIVQDEPQVKRLGKLTRSQRKRMPKSQFVFPERRAWPIDSAKRAATAINYIHMGRVATKSDYLKIRNAIIRRYGADFWKSHGAPTWEKVARSKGKRARTTARKALPAAA